MARKKRRCRECGASSEGASIGRGGRCGPCGVERMVLGLRWNGVTANMKTHEMRRELRGLEERYAAGRDPGQFSELGSKAGRPQ